MTDAAVARTQEQSDGVRNTLIWTLGLIGLILGLFLYTFLSPKALSQDALRGLGYFGFPQPRAIKEFVLVNQDGRVVGVDDLKGDWHLIFFGFTFCPDICPTTMGVLNRAVTAMEKPPKVIMVSVDPERDTPEALARYVPAFNKDFTGYTGEFEDIVGFATNLNAAFGKVPGKEPGTYTVDHSASIAVIDPEGRYVGFLKSPHQAPNIQQVMTSLML